MTNKEMVTMKKPDSQLRLYLPKELCDRAGIASGRPVILSGTEDGIYIPAFWISCGTISASFSGSRSFCGKEKGKAYEPGTGFMKVGCVLCPDRKIQED